jgi:hypothetical protein
MNISSPSITITDQSVNPNVALSARRVPAVSSTAGFAARNPAIASGAMIGM